MMLQEKLSHFLDLVEVDLVREISAKSDSFFEALDQLEDLNRRILGACDQIGELQGTIRLLDSDIVDSARHLLGLKMSRDDMLELHQKLKLLAYVNQALSTLRLVCLRQAYHFFKWLIHMLPVLLIPSLSLEFSMH